MKHTLLILGLTLALSVPALAIEQQAEQFHSEAQERLVWECHHGRRCVWFQDSSGQEHWLPYRD